MWLIAALAGLAAVVTSALPWHDAVATTRQVAPVLGFLAAVTVLARLADRTGLFDLLARQAARAAGGSTRRLLFVVCGIATLVTVTLSLDTTAVLLTPVVLALTTAVAVDPRPFAYATIWLANTGSLLLPVSNLTNLLALQRLSGLGVPGFAVRMVLPEAVAVVVVMAVVQLLFRDSLRGNYRWPSPHEVVDAPLLWLAAACCLVVAPATLLGFPPWMIATPAALLLAVGTRLRGHSLHLVTAVPWRILLLAEGLFLAMAALGRHGLDAVLRHTTGHGSFLVDLTAAGLSNVTNNLPAFLALERAVPPGHRQELLALLLGTNVGPVLLVSGSLATMLWRDRCRDRGLIISTRAFLRYGLVLIVPLLGLTYVALLFGPG